MKKAIAILCVTALIGSTVGCLHRKYLYKMNLDEALAVYDGEIKAPGLAAPVHVYRDAYAVPHIMAASEPDLFFALGYVHAQDRLWQMMLFRAIAEGRTAELFGKIKVPGASFKGFPVDTMMIDRQQRSMGMKYVGEAGAALLEAQRPDLYRVLLAYSQGVNSYLETHADWDQLPVEFQVLKVKPEPWRPADCISFGRLMGFILGYNMMVELLRSAILEKYGEDLMWEVCPTHVSHGPTIVPPEMLHNRLATPRPGLPPGGRPSREELGFDPLETDGAAEALLAGVDVIRRTVSADLPFASNNWVIAPQLTTTGTAMLANDTHMPHIQPSIWTMGHLQCPTIDVYGAIFPGTPFTALGHTRDLAWSATTSIADVQDLFVETENGTHDRYLHKGEWKPYVIRHETIRVRQTPFPDRFKEIDLEIRQTVHGPILTDYLPLPNQTRPVALRWTAWDFSRDQRLFDALTGSSDVDEFMGKARAIPGLKLGSVVMSMDLLMKGKSIDDFIAAMDVLDMPSQNWMAADSAGSIAYLPGGYVPIRGKGLGALPVPGESGDFDWTGFIPLMELPHAINPARGYMASGNNEVVDAEWYPYLFDLNYDAGWRAWRVEELIRELAPIDMADMIRIQNDVYVKKAEVEVPMILAAIENKGVTDPDVLLGRDLLAAWDLEADLDSKATAIFFKYAQDMRYNVFGDEVAKEDFEKFLSESHVDIAVEALLKKGESWVFDDKTTPNVVEDKDDIIVKSIKTAVTFMKKRYGANVENWAWGKVHPMKFYHPLGFGPLKGLSVYVGPEVGGRHTVRCASPADSGRWHFKSMNGTSWRHLIDLGDPDNALAMIDGSISGQWLSPHYDDLVKVWHQGEHLRATMKQDEVIAEAQYHLVLSP